MKCASNFPPLTLAAPAECPAGGPAGEFPLVPPPRMLFRHRQAGRGSHMRVASIGECMVELTLPRGDGAGSRVGFAGDTFNAAVYLKRSAPEVAGRLRHRPRHRPAVRPDDRLLRGRGPRHRPDRAPRRPRPRPLRHQPRRQGRAQLHLLARHLRRPHPLPAPGRGNPREPQGFDLVYLSGITLAVLAPEARAALAAFLDAYRRRGGRLAFELELPPPPLARRRHRPPRDHRLLDEDRHRPPLPRRRDGALRR